MVFSVNTDGTGFQNLYTFTGGQDGNGPQAGLVLSGETLYGTAETGGSTGWGTVFSVQTNGSNFTMLHTFTGEAGGGNPYGTLVLSDTTLYGTTFAGGVSNSGTVFAIQTNGSNFTALYDLAGPMDGANPAAGLILSGTTLIGTAEYQGVGNYGTIFSAETNGQNFVALHSFTSSFITGPRVNDDGAYPQSGVIAAGSNYYGTASDGGQAGHGTIFTLQTNGSNFAALYSFTNGADGANPQASLTFRSNILYGTAINGGIFGQGTVFALNADNAEFSTLHSFAGGTDGANPAGRLLLWSNVFYGTTVNGGASNNGTIFAINPDGSDYTVLYSFTGGSDGAAPQAGLAVWSNSWLICTASGGGTSGNGTIFALKVTPPGQARKLGDATTASTSLGGGIYGSYPTCTASVAIPLIRGDGFTELTGDIIFTSAGGGVAGNSGGISLTTFNPTMPGFGPITTVPLSLAIGAGANGRVTLANGFGFFTLPSDGPLGNGAIGVFNPNNQSIANLYAYPGGDSGSIPTGDILWNCGHLIVSTSYGGSGGTGTLGAINPCSGTQSYAAPVITSATYSGGTLQIGYSAGLPPPTPEAPDSPLRFLVTDSSGLLNIGTFDVGNDGGTTSGTASLSVSSPPSSIALSFFTPCGQSAMSASFAVSTPAIAPGTTAANFINSGNVLCPISTFSGELYENMPPDLNLGGPMPLIFQRYYASRLQSDGFISGRLGVNWLHNFEMSLTTPASGLVQVVTQFGRVIQFTNTGGAFSLVGRLDVPYQLAAGGSGYILGDPGSQRLYTFSSNGLLTQIADDHGNAQTLSYSGDLLTSVTDGLGRTMSLQYDSTKQLTNVTDGSRSASFMQTGSFLTSSSDALGNTTTYTYDMANPVSGLLTAAILPNGNAPFTQSYNTNGQVVIQVAAGAFPGTNTLSYEAGVTTITDPFGNQTRQSNSAAGLLTTAVDEAGFAAQLGYNAFGQRTAVTNRLGQVTLTTYHAPSGKVSSITYPDGSVWNFTYTNRIVSGITFYDLAQIDYADGTTDDFTYDNNGNLISYTDRAGEVWSFTYDAHGQKLTTTDPADGVATLAYNSDETLAARQDSDVGLITFAYDQFRRLTTITLPDNSQAESARLKMG